MDVAEQIQPRLESAIGQRYEVLGPIGRGGMASVYLARHRVHGGFCAVKVLADHLAKQPPLVRSFLTEARASASLDEHPNIVNIVDIDEHAGLYYMIMKYVEGEDLSSYMQRKKELPWKQAAYIAAETAEALSWSHDRGVIHRDLKPSNIRLNRRGGVTVMDFGIAKVGQTPSSFTEMGTRAGTPHYMAPEQIRGDAVDHRSDLYGLGVILYQMATATRPFTGSNPALIWQAHLNEEPKPPQQLTPSIPDPLNHIILTLLAKDVNKRYDSAERVVRHLRTLGLEGVKSTLDPIDQLDLDYLRTQEIQERRPHPAGTRGVPAPEITETGQSGGPTASEAEAVPVSEPTPAQAPASGRNDATVARPHSTPVAHRREATPIGERTGPIPASKDSQPPVTEPEDEPAAEPAVAEMRAEPAPGPQPAQPERQPTPAHAPQRTPTAQRPAAKRAGQTAATRVPEPAPPTEAPPLRQTSSMPTLPAPARHTAPRPPVTDTFAVPKAGPNRAPLFVGLGVVAVLTLAAALFFRPSGASTPAPQPKDEIPAPAAQVDAPPQPPPREEAAPPAVEPAAKPAAPVPPPKRAAPRTGAIYFRTEPAGARIQVDNRPDWTCEAPCWLEALPPGRHTVTARLADYRVSISRVNVAAGSREPLQLHLEADLIAAMIASKPPGAEIYIDGEKQAEKTNARIALKPGTYQIRVVLPDGLVGEQVLVVNESQMPYANFVFEAK